MVPTFRQINLEGIKFELLVQGIVALERTIFEANEIYFQMKQMTLEYDTDLHLIFFHLAEQKYLITIVDFNTISYTEAKKIAMSN